MARKKPLKQLRRNITYRLLYILVMGLVNVSRLVPRIAWLKFCGAAGGLAYHLASGPRRLTLTHLTLAFGREKSPEEIAALAKDVFVMLGKNAGDVLRSFRIETMEEFDRIREIRGLEHAEAAYARRKGVIFLTGHLGAFELLGNELALRGYKPHIIGTPLKDERLNEMLRKQRGKLGGVVIERGKESVRLIKALLTGGTVAMLIDQDTRVKSRFVNFFGIPCATPIGATLLALKTGAAVVPLFINLRDDHMQEMNLYPEVELTVSGDMEEDLLVNTQRLNDVIEAEIRKYPSQWLWMHKRWKTKPGKEIR